MLRKFSLLALLIGSIPTALFAQYQPDKPASLFSWSGERSPAGDMPSIVTDRPDFTEASTTVLLGVTQLEVGYTYAKSNDLHSHSWGEPLIRHGLLANWFELRFAAAPISEFGSHSSHGMEDLYFGAKVALTLQDGMLPEMAIVPQMTVPTGSSAFSAERVLPGTNLLYGWDINDKYSLGGSTQYNRAVNDSLLPYDEWAQSLTVGRSITDRVGSYYEWFAFFPDDAHSVPPEHYLDGGLTFQMTDDIQFDIRGGKGLSKSSDDYFLGTGVSIRFR